MSDHDTRQRERVEALRAIMTAPQTSSFAWVPLLEQACSSMAPSWGCLLLSFRFR